MNQMHTEPDMSDLQALQETLSRGGPYAIAVSGGVDSMTLAHVAHGIGGTRRCIHCGQSYARARSEPWTPIAVHTFSTSELCSRVTSQSRPSVTAYGERNHVSSFPFHLKIFELIVD